MPKARPVRFESDGQMYAIVGEFLHNWLWLEAAINRLLVRMIRAPDMHASILGPNIEFRRKLNILRVGAPVSPHFTALRKSQKVLDLVTTTAGFYADRNILVHYPWSRSDAGKLIIQRTQAVDKLVDADVAWTKRQMIWKAKESARAVKEFWDIAQAIKPTDTEPTNWLKVFSEIEYNNETSPQ